MAQANADRIGLSALAIVLDHFSLFAHDKPLAIRWPIILQVTLPIHELLDAAIRQEDDLPEMRDSLAEVTLSTSSVRQEVCGVFAADLR